MAGTHGGQDVFLKICGKAVLAVVNKTFRAAAGEFGALGVQLLDHSLYVGKLEGRDGNDEKFVAVNVVDDRFRFAVFLLDGTLKD
ncbi:hypothetical protein IKZ80_06420 [bacterium]|nr:hypothetical protein [bacterium]